MARYQIYTEYVDTKLDWLRRVPSGWKTLRLSQYFDERREKVSDKEYEPLSVTMQGIVPRIDTAAKTNAGDNRKKVCAGDFVINSRSDRKGSSGVSPHEGSVSLISIVLKPQGIESSFVHHLLRSIPFQEEFYRYGKGIVADLWSTNYSEMKNIVIPIPSVSEQQIIAAFLDHETAKIDLLIARQEWLIELLAEKRQAVISHAVRSSGTSAPVKLGYFVDLLPGYAFPSASFSHDETDMPLLRGINVGVESIRWDETVYWPKDGCAELQLFALKSGDLVFGMDRPWISGGARVAEVTEADVPSLLLQRVCRLRARKGLKQKFLKLILSSKEFKDYVESDLTGVSVPHISTDQIASFRFRLPSEEQQELVCKSIDEQFQKIQATSSKADEAIDLMREHRTVLISAAVTGKIDVRDWQKPDTETEETATAVSA